MTRNVDNNEDVLDSRDIIERIAELKAEWDESAEDDHMNYDLSEDDWAVQLGEDDARLLVALMELAEEGAQYAEDWKYGVQLIRDSYFEEYARQFADDIGAIDAKATWPLDHIDWKVAAEHLQMDYTEVDFDGVAYWVR